MVWHWLFFYVSFKTFRLVLEPSSVRVIQRAARRTSAEENSECNFKKTKCETLCTREVDLGGVRVVWHETNFHKWLSLEAWMSIKVPQSGSDHIAIPEVYKSFGPRMSRATFSWNFSRNFPQRASDVVWVEWGSSTWLSSLTSGCYTQLWSHSHRSPSS